MPKLLDYFEFLCFFYNSLHVEVVMVLNALITNGVKYLMYDRPFN